MASESVQSDAKYYESDDSYVLEDGSDGMEEDDVGELMQVKEYKRRVLNHELEPPNQDTGMWLHWWIKLSESERKAVLDKPRSKTMRGEQEARIVSAHCGF